MPILPAARSTRRSFLQLSAAALALPAVGCRILSRRIRYVSGRLRHACIGVGGIGVLDLSRISAHPGVDIVALCDIDAKNLEKAAESAPDARRYSDWRALLAAEDGRIDSVSVSVPDHMHAPITMAAMRKRLHVYCQKPLTHTVLEARRIAEGARRFAVVTQMGIQNHSGVHYRRAFHVLRSGLLGPVREVHVWTDRPAGWWPQNVERSEGSDPVPEHVDWDGWLGVAPERPYKEGAYHPFVWRGRLDFGTGAQGDMACHLIDPALWFLDLGAPTRLWSDGPAPNGESYPEWSTVHYEFPPTRHTTGDSLRLTWYDGGRMPTALLEELGAGEEPWKNACLFVCEAGALLASPYRTARLLPEGRFPEVEPPELPELDHWRQWVDACFGLGEPSAPFAYAGPLTEVALLGNVALHFPGERLDWDAGRLRCSNRRGAGALLTRGYRAGWEDHGLT